MSKVPRSKKHRLQQRHYRLYIGNGNWVTLPDHITNDLLDIYERGVAARYHVAPGLAFDIIPNDMDCNSRNASLPKLMRVDLCYEGADDSNAVQEHLSRWIKHVLEAQGTVDAFPPPSSDRKENEPSTSLPRVMSLDPHRHLHLVPSLPLSVAGRRRTSIAQAPITCDNTPISQSHPIQSLATTSDNNPISPQQHTIPSNKQTRIRRRQQSPSSFTGSLYWTNIPHQSGNSNALSFRERQQLGSYDAFLQLPHGPSSSWIGIGDTVSSSSHDRHFAETCPNGGNSNDINICDGDLSFPNWSLLGTDDMDQQQQQQELSINQRNRLHLNPLLAHTPHEPVSLTTVSSVSQSPPTAIFLSNSNNVMEQSLPKSPVLSQCSIKAQQVESCTQVSDTS
ncbi:hypothetical protein K492DRAFT_199902 [Lichtheimia hyalospora FSU 10163]|nr:hypothetical protein K492DRAFT_199902 [Lichtheimia hyalospora FSU 10163]